MDRVRVLQLLTGIAIGEQSGGAEQIGLQIALHLDRTQFEPAVFVMQRYNAPAEMLWQSRLNEGQVPLYGFATPRRGLSASLSEIWRMLWACVTTFRPDVINSHSERGDTLNMLLRLLHPRHPVAVRTMHTDQQWHTRPRLGKFLSQGIFPLIFADEIAVSQAVRQVLNQRPLARLLGRQAILCYPAVDTAPFRRRDIGPLPPGMPADRPRIGIIGRLVEQKGHTFLLQAIARLAASQPIHLVVIGSGPLEGNLRAQAAALGIADQVHFLGSRRDIAAILPHLDLVVSASLWEGLPGVILEAMAAQTPVIATDVSGSREVVLHGQTGLLTPAGRADALADAIKQALEQPGRMQKMAQRASQHVAGFTVEKMVECYATVYWALSGRPRPGPERVWNGP